MWHDPRTLNRLANGLFSAVVLAALACGGWWVAQRPLFTLKMIELEETHGERLRHVNAATIRSTALPRIQGNFFTANLDVVRQAFEAVPWVSKAMVRREWPNKLIVSVDEHDALGTWGEDGRLVSVKGDVFTANLAEAEEDVDLLEFAGPEGTAREVVTRYIELQNWLRPIQLQPEAVTLSDRYAWSVRLSNGMALELGREQDNTTMKERVLRLVAIYPQLAAGLQDRIESADMRYPNGLALRVSGMEVSKKKINGRYDKRR